MIVAFAAFLFWLELDFDLVAPWWLWVTVLFVFIDDCVASHMIRHAYKRVMSR